MDCNCKWHDHSQKVQLKICCENIYLKYFSFDGAHSISIKTVIVKLTTYKDTKWYYSIFSKVNKITSYQLKINETY